MRTFASSSCAAVNLVRTRPLSKAEQAAFEKLEKEDQVPKTSPQHESVVYALRQLTGKDYGTTYEQWNDGLQKASTPQPQPKPEPKTQPQPDPKTQPQPTPVKPPEPKPQPQPQKPE